jgi:hypothetical protein
MAQPPANQSPRRPEGPRRVRTPLERGFWPSLALTGGVLVRLRLPPLPFGLVVVLGIWFLCYLGVFFWFARAGRPPE